MARKAKATPAKKPTTGCAEDKRVLAFRYINAKKRLDGKTFRVMGPLKMGGGFEGSGLTLSNIECMITRREITGFVNSIAGGNDLITYLPKVEAEEKPSNLVPVS